MTLPETYQSQAKHVQPSPKFKVEADLSYHANPFPGYSVITPTPEDDGQNAEFYRQIAHWQTRLLESLPEGVLIPIPASSFHVTLADLIWNDAYRYASQDATFETRLRDCIADSFARSQAMVASDRLIAWQVIGFMIMTRGIAIALAPKAESAYQSITELRRNIYQNPHLIGLGIEQQYHLTAHITLGYFSESVTKLDPEEFGNVVSTVNQALQEANLPEELVVHHAELRKFDDMTHYYREASWPVLSFVKS
jgi:hypothetical protein